MKLEICHLYPDLLNLYGDTGNIICMKKRLQWRGVDVSVTPLPAGSRDSLTKFDLFFLGGGQDFEQEVLIDDLHSGKDRNIRAAIEDGRTFLAICGGYQILGNYYENASGRRCDYLGAIDFHTTSSSKRMVGNVAFRCNSESGGSMVVGFENHGGRTFLGSGVKSLGKVIYGHGNNGVDHNEGIRYLNVFGTYCHGPVLPKNPKFCDFILATALKQKYGECTLEPLDDRFENEAHRMALRKLMR